MKSRNCYVYVLSLSLFVISLTPPEGYAGYPHYIQPSVYRCVRTVTNYILTILVPRQGLWLPDCLMQCQKCVVGTDGISFIR